MAATADARDIIGEATLGELEATLRGHLVRPADPDYDQARAVWNAAHDRRPALIVRCAAAADVIRAVEFARSEGLQVAVRGGAHSIAGFSTTDGGVVIDLSPMKGIRVDPAGRRVPLGLVGPTRPGAGQPQHLMALGPQAAGQGRADQPGGAGHGDQHWLPSLIPNAVEQAFASRGPAVAG